MPRFKVHLGSKKGRGYEEYQRFTLCESVQNWAFMSDSWSHVSQKHANFY